MEFTNVVLYIFEGLKPVEAEVLALCKDDEMVSSVKRGLNCWVILNKTNFYAEDDDQAGDTGIIQCEVCFISFYFIFYVNFSRQFYA